MVESKILFDSRSSHATIRPSQTVVIPIENGCPMILGLGPVVRYELITTARRGRFYIARARHLDQPGDDPAHAHRDRPRQAVWRCLECPPDRACPSHHVGPGSLARDDSSAGPDGSRGICCARRLGHRDDRRPRFIARQKLDPGALHDFHHAFDLIQRSVNGRSPCGNYSFPRRTQSMSEQKGSSISAKLFPASATKTHRPQSTGW
jgi:hypothetical protein